MPVDCAIDHERKRVHLIITDPLSRPDVLATLDAVAAQGAWSYMLLNDSRACHWVPTAADVEQFRRRAESLTQQHGPRGAVAIVITGHGAQYGMTRMIAATSQSDMEIFERIEDAAAWLDQADHSPAHSDRSAPHSGA